MFSCILKRSSKPDLNVSIFQSIKELNTTDWNSVVKTKNIYLSISYLSALEESLAQDIVFRYLIFYNNNAKPVAVAAVNTLKFLDKGIKDKGQLCEVRNAIKNHFIKSFDLDVMTCGSPFSSGQNGFAFTDDLTEKEAYESLGLALIELQKNKNITAQVILLKEFWPESFDSSHHIVTHDYKDFMIDVNMVMKIPEDWKCLDDYLASMVTKFRTKAKSAFKKSDALLIRDLDLLDIITHKSTIESLYAAVLDKSPFKFGSLNSDTFVALKRNLKDLFVVKGYFLNDELLGFSSAFICDDIVDANYVGINYELNQTYGIYQRMLYDYVALAIENGCSELRFGRTAEEIKSTIGAEPINMKLYIRHKNKITNKILKSVFAGIKPSDFELRKPFKAVNYAPVLVG
jgi:hypothetical protein